MLIWSKEFIAGRTAVYGRVKDYWARTLNVNVGRDNFDEIRYTNKSAMYRRPVPGLGVGEALDFRFGDFEIDTARHELRRAGAVVHIEPQVFDLIVHLVRNHDRIVSKDELIDAIWQGRIVSEATLSSRISAARRALGDSGNDQTLIRTLHKRGFRFVGEVYENGSALPATAGDQGPSPREVANDAPKLVPNAEPLPLPDKPSIAVLPFQNMSDDPKQEYFADGMAEEIITALCHMRWLFVIARDSSFVYKGRTVDVKQVGRELGVRYVVEGGVRKAGHRVRITAQLIDAATGAHLWADHFDGDLDDIFDLQDQIAASVVGAIAPKLEQAEIERAKRKPTESLDAYDYFLRGMACTHRTTREATTEALELFAKAIELDPDFASAYGVAAFCYVVRKINGWTIDREQEIADAARLAWRAATLGKDDAVALAFGGLALGYVAGDLEGAVALIDRALVLNPNLAVGWYASGTVRAFRGGEPDVAIEHLKRAMRLSPFDPFMFTMQGVTAFAHFFAGRYDEAVSWAERAFWERPNILATLRIAAASNALAGRREEAQKAVARALELDPGMRVSNLRERIGWFRRPEDFAKYTDALRKAGLPE